MKILLDEMLPAGVAGLLPEHEVVTVQQAGYKGLTNGELLSRASAAVWPRPGRHRLPAPQCCYAASHEDVPVDRAVPRHGRSSG